MLKQLNIYFLGWSMIISMSCLYIFGFFPAPYYIFLAIGFFLIALSYEKIKVTFDGVVLLILILIYFGIIQFYNSTTNVWSYYFIALFVSVLLVTVKNSFSTYEKIKLIRNTAYVYLFSYSIDTILRFIYPKKSYIESLELHDKSDLMFYAYKHSFIFQDSNFVGLSLIALYFLILANKDIFYKKYNIIISLNIILILLSLSRAAIVVFFIVSFIYIFRNKDTLYKMLCFIFIFFSMILFGFLFLDTIHITDDSFKSKFMLLNLFVHNYHSLSINDLLFGWGLNQTYTHWGISAHNLYITILLETGILGFLVVLLTFIFFLKKSNRCHYQIIAYSIISLSFGLIFTPVLIPIALNCLFDKNSDVKRYAKKNHYY
ncbi:TPA: hypothetical protein ACX6PM_003835 [Photobacterium damselae]